MPEPSSRDWELLLSLSWTGADEYPWGWDKGTAWPDDWKSRDYEDMIRRCAAKLRDEGKFSVREADDHAAGDRTLVARMKQFVGHIEDMSDDERVFMLGALCGALERRLRLAGEL